MIYFSTFKNQNKFVFSVFSLFGRQIVSGRMVHIFPLLSSGMSLLFKTSLEYFQTHESDLNKPVSKDQHRVLSARVFLESISITGSIRLHMWQVVIKRE